MVHPQSTDFPPARDSSGCSCLKAEVVRIRKLLLELVTGPHAASYKNNRAILLFVQEKVQEKGAPAVITRGLEYLKAPQEKVTKVPPAEPQAQKIQPCRPAPAQKPKPTTLEGPAPAAPPVAFPVAPPRPPRVAASLPPALTPKPPAPPAAAPQAPPPPSAPKGSASLFGVEKTGAEKAGGVPVEKPAEEIMSAPCEAPPEGGYFSIVVADKEILDELKHPTVEEIVPEKAEKPTPEETKEIMPEKAKEVEQEPPQPETDELKREPVPKRGVKKVSEERYRQAEAKRDEADRKQAPLLARPAESFEEERETMPRERMMAKRRISPLFTLLRLPFLILFLPFRLVFYLGKGVIIVIGKPFVFLFRLARSGKELLQKMEERARTQGVPFFESLLSENAGRPGPVERTAAQSVLFMRAVQATIGLRFIALANCIDTFLDIVTGYLNTIFSTWKMTKAIHKRIQRERNHSQLQSLLEDLFLARLRLSRIFSFAGFHLDEVAGKLPSPKSETLIAPTFALKLILEARGHLDEMKRDLDFLTVREVMQLVRKTTGDFLLSFVPNPANLVIPWKDILILTFIMKYSREEIERMYFQFVQHYLRAIALLEEAYLKDNVTQHQEPWVEGLRYLVFYEDLMGERLTQTGQNLEKAETLEDATIKCRRSLQRLLQALCNPEQFINPRKWPVFDLLCEVNKEAVTASIHPKYELELERWLTRAVETALKKIGVKPDLREKELRWEEARDFRTRYRLQQKLSKDFRTV